MISASLQACGVVFPLASSTSTCRSGVHDLLRLVFFNRRARFAPSEFSLTPPGTKNPGHVSIAQLAVSILALFRPTAKK